MSGILWIIIVGFVAGIIARVLSPGPNNPSGFILTTVLGIVGAFLATLIGQRCSVDCRLGQGLHGELAGAVSDLVGIAVGGDNADAERIRIGFREFGDVVCNRTVGETTVLFVKRDQVLL